MLSFKIGSLCWFFFLYDFLWSLFFADWFPFVSFSWWIESWNSSLESCKIPAHSSCYFGHLAAFRKRTFWNLKILFLKIKLSSPECLCHSATSSTTLLILWLLILRLLCQLLRTCMLFLLFLHSFRSICGTWTVRSHSKSFEFSEWLLLSCEFVFLHLILIILYT